MSRPTFRDWDRLVADHHDAAAEFARQAEAVPADAWQAPWAPGKWTCAEVVEHVGLAYDNLTRELRGGAPMEVRVRPLMRLAIRWRMWPAILEGRFPAGARAPRETRPGTGPAAGDPQAVALARFRERAAGFAAVIAEVRAATPRRRLTHPYFGSVPLPEALRFVAVHLRHHQAQLAAAAGAAAER